MGDMAVINNPKVINVPVGATALAEGVFVDYLAAGATITDDTGDTTAIGVTTAPAVVGGMASLFDLEGGGIMKAKTATDFTQGAAVYISAAGLATDTQPSGGIAIGVAIYAVAAAGDYVSFKRVNPTIVVVV